jgi:hypothetical protein
MMKKSCKMFGLLLLIPMAAVFCGPSALAQSCTTATCNAAGVSEAQFLAALPAASNTNATVVVNIPAGTSGWTTGFSYTIPPAVTNLTIQGATTVNCTGTAGTSTYSCAATDGTVIQDNDNSNIPLIAITTGGNSSQVRFTGLTMQGGTATLPKYGAIEIFGHSHNLRVDHNHFNIAGYSSSVSGDWVRFQGDNEGVLDHNLVDMGANLGNAWFGFLAFNAVGDSIGNGDGTFQNPTPFGTSAFIFIESNQFNGGYGDDCDFAGAFVMRYNKFYGMTVAEQTHATKTDGGPERGCRAFEFYHNYIAAGTIEKDAMTGSKGASGLIWGNTMEGSTAYRFWAGGTDRGSGGQAETNTPIGWGYCGTSILSNGVGSAWDGNSNASTGYPCLDGIGRGQTTQALNGANLPGRLNSVTTTIAWPHQYLEPTYLWMNSIGAATELSIRDNSTTQNIDIFADNASFNGTTGTGYGPFSARPSTCTPGPGGTYYTSPTGSYGVSYWATDANNGSGELYVCSSTDTWTGIYQPYTYPHPLTGGTAAPASVNPPTDLTTSVQ